MERALRNCNIILLNPHRRKKNFYFFPVVPPKQSIQPGPARVNKGNNSRKNSHDMKNGKGPNKM